MARDLAVMTTHAARVDACLNEGLRTLGRPATPEDREELARVALGAVALAAIYPDAESALAAVHLGIRPRRAARHDAREKLLATPCPYHGGHCDAVGVDGRRVTWRCGSTLDADGPTVRALAVVSKEAR